jgi:hypothetical protein
MDWRYGKMIRCAYRGNAVYILNSPNKEQTKLSRVVSVMLTGRPPSNGLRQKTVEHQLIEICARYLP